MFTYATSWEVLRVYYVQKKNSKTDQKSVIVYEAPIEVYRLKRAREVFFKGSYVIGIKG